MQQKTTNQTKKIIVLGARKGLYSKDESHPLEQTPIAHQEIPRQFHEELADYMN